LNYGEFGLSDRRSGRPNKAWQLLRLFALKNGTIDSRSGDFRTWSRVEKSVQALRELFRSKFRLSSDPIPFVRKRGYQVRFKITCGPSFHT
jgi:hypothetical protein